MYVNIIFKKEKKIFLMPYTKNSPMTIILNFLFSSILIYCALSCNKCFLVWLIQICKTVLLISFLLGGSRPKLKSLYLWNYSLDLSSVKCTGIIVIQRMYVCKGYIAYSKSFPLPLEGLSPPSLPTLSLIL